MKELRPYQIDIANKGVSILRSKMIVYLAMQVRTGKTATSLEVCRLFGAKTVFFLTKKKAIDAIKKDYIDFGFDRHFEITVTNDESLHKVTENFDVIIHDEHHRFGAYPKPGKATRLFKQKYGKKPHIYLSGTPTPESFSQVFHQFWVSDFSPFGTNFYKWAKEWVTVKQIRIGHTSVNDYSNCDKKVLDHLSDYFLYYTQGQAGFKCEIKEHLIMVPTPDKIDTYIKRLKKDRVIKGQNDVILADTAAKLMSKVHQISSGTVILESGKPIVLDPFKARFSFENFRNNKIVIFYKFAAELTALQSVWGDELTTDFDKWKGWVFDGALAVQMVSGREAMNYSEAEMLVFFNIDFSALTYWQARDRMTTIDREVAHVVWLCSTKGIERDVYKTVTDKKDYTLTHFKAHELPKKSNRQVDQGRLFCD